MRQATLCFPLTIDKILLGLKRKKVGAGLYNGFGGMVEDHDASVAAAALRELREEIGLEAELRDLVDAALLRMTWRDRPDWDQEIHVYLLGTWQGQPKPSEEMCPEWFALDAVPYDKMLAADRYWLPQVLSGELVSGEFVYDERRIVSKMVYPL